MKKSSLLLLLLLLLLRVPASSCQGGQPASSRRQPETSSMIVMEFIVVPSASLNIKSRVDYSEVLISSQSIGVDQLCLQSLMYAQEQLWTWRCERLHKCFPE
ncbi:hypothetical protein ACRRTK_014097 [Alexandromys fortis]